MFSIDTYALVQHLPNWSGAVNAFARYRHAASQCLLNFNSDCFYQINWRVGGVIQYGIAAAIAINWKLLVKRLPVFTAIRLIDVGFQFNLDTLYKWFAARYAVSWDNVNYACIPLELAALLSLSHFVPRHRKVISCLIAVHLLLGYWARSIRESGIYSHLVRAEVSWYAANTALLAYSLYALYDAKNGTFPVEKSDVRRRRRRERRCAELAEARHAAASQ